MLRLTTNSEIFMKCFRVNIIKLCKHCHTSNTDVNESLGGKKESKRLSEFRKKLRETSPIDDLGEQPIINSEEDSLSPWPNNTNPDTGEVGGPRGPEPTRYGDWERKGRVSDF